MGLAVSPRLGPGLRLPLPRVSTRTGWLSTTSSPPTREHSLTTSLPESAAPPSIAELVGLASGGDAVAARVLYERHVGATWTYCLAFVRGDDALARDLCQDSFAVAFARLRQLQEPAAFSGWLRTITRRTCLGWAQARRVERTGLSRLTDQEQHALESRVAAPVSAPTELPEELARLRSSAIVREVIEACPDEGLRAVARLFYTEPPHSTGEIGQQLGISRTAVTSRLHRFRSWARATMLSRLQDAVEVR